MKAMHRDLLRTIRKTFGRYAAILAIIALGSGFLAGLRCTKSAMMATAQHYVDQQMLFDLRVLNTYGYTQADVEKLRSAPGIRAAEGMVTLDVLVKQPDREAEIAVRLMNLSRDVSVPVLQAGRMPERAGECLADGYQFSSRDLGKTFLITDTNQQSTRDRLSVEKLTVVGLCSSPQFMNFERGSTSVGNGSLTAFLYVTNTTFDMDGVFTEVQLRLDRDYAIYSEAYDDRLDSQRDILEPLAQELADRRYETVRRDAQWELEDGQKEYDDGLKEFTEQKEKALSELDEARGKLEDGRRELEDKQTLLEQGEKTLAAAQAQVDAGMKLLTDGEKQLQEEKASAYSQFAQNEAMLSSQLAAAQSGLRQLDSGLAQIDNGLAQIQSGLDQIETGLRQLDIALGVAQTGLDTTQRLLELVERGLAANPEDPNLLASKEALEAQLADLQTQITELLAQRQEAAAMQTPLLEKQAELLDQRAELLEQRAAVYDGLQQLQDGKEQLDSARKQADDSFTAAEAQLAASRLELEAGQRELDANRAELEEGRRLLDEGWAQWESGKAEFDTAEAEAMQELADAEQKLADAAKALEDGRTALAEMGPAEVYLLDRNTNVAYVCFESDADIVAGVSKIFPLFFFAVAALVCLTTMSKMVDEERTQIGVKKALGYSNLAISSKYLIYAGTAALGGCLLGVSLGSVVFPKVIWMGYNIMYNFSPKIDLAVDVPLCCLIVAAFTLVMLLVTWYSCRRELTDVPADLIRPKAPQAGKRLILERLPLWNRLSFLRKVSVRNIFMYQKRLVMMLLGVGGCTALVITGLGLGDTIVDIAATQFGEITVYDMNVSFTKAQDEAAQDRFLENLAGQVDGVRFCHSATVDLTAGSRTKSVSLVAPQGDLAGYIDLHKGSSPVAFPGRNEAVVNNGLARAMDLQVGDTVIVRNADMETLELTVSGVFDNAVSNYVICSQETLEDQWGHPGEYNTAYVNAAEGPEVHSAAAAVSRQADVVSVTVSQDMLTRVSNMLSSMNYIVVMVIICAAALAFIVMYNLTNINITERIREIATIKVLGFYPGESAAYVFREGMALTVMGSLVGMIAGKYLHAFVIDKIRIDFVYFAPRVDWFSYIAAVLLTILFSIVVDFFLYFKLENIHMAEALKSVE